MDISPNPRPTHIASEHRAVDQVDRGEGSENHGGLLKQDDAKDLNIEFQEIRSIPVHVTSSHVRTSLTKTMNNFPHKVQSNLKTVKRSDKAVQALDLPVLINLNPRSLNNKIEAFKTYMDEEQVDIAFISESHEREQYPLVDSLNMEDYEIISNVHQRRGKGGRPALVVKKDKYHIVNLTNTLINIPWGVEAVWAVITPKILTNDSKIKKIAICSFYNRNKRSKFKTALINHIAEAFNIISRKYTSGLHFILAADANHLNLDPILSLRPDMRSVVENHTRTGPPLLCWIPSSQH